MGSIAWRRPGTSRSTGGSRQAGSWTPGAAPSPLVSLDRAAQETVEVVTVEPHVQALVQEIIAGQGTGITEEIIKEVREHAVSLDLGIDRAWATLRGRPKPDIVLPDFPVAIRTRSPTRRRWPAGPTSAAGTQGS